jgi:hypothetical protein
MQTIISMEMDGAKCADGDGLMLGAWQGWCKHDIVGGIYMVKIKENYT